MNMDIISTLGPNYRQDLVRLVLLIVRAGDSCSIVGVSGTAKSNLFRHLLDPAIRQEHLGEEWDKYLFVPVDCNELAEKTERGMYSLMLEGLVGEVKQTKLKKSVIGVVEACHGQALGRGDDTLVAHQCLALAVKEVVHHVHLVFVLDQLDKVYKPLNPRVFANLRALRDQFKYRISYVVFTREELPYISSAPESEEFYELLSPNVVGLGPYNHEDSWTLLRRVAGRYGWEPDSPLGERLITLTGGHPGLLKAAYMAAMRGGVTLPETDANAIQTLLNDANVQTECHNLWESIREDEREALRSLSMGNSLSPVDPDLLRRLRLKYLIVEADKGIAISCPLFAGYVSRQKVVRPPEIKIQAGPIRIDASGDVWLEGEKLKPPLRPLEFKLLAHLCSKPGVLCTRDEIIKVLYPDVADREGYEGVSDDAVNSVVRRLRKRIERGREPPKYITTVRGLGYRLDGL